LRRGFGRKCWRYARPAGPTGETGQIRESETDLPSGERCGQEERVVEPSPSGTRFNKVDLTLRKKHMEDLSRGEIAPTVTVAFVAALNAYSRVRDHVHDVAEEISEEK